MNTDDAVYHTVHDYPGGCESLGPRVGISPKVLQNKANPTHERLQADVYSIKSILAEIMARIDVLAEQTARRAIFKSKPMPCKK